MIFKIEWEDGFREPQCPPDPNYPRGKDVRLSEAFRVNGPTCIAQLPYPAKRCGMYVVECERCGVTVGVTTAGRPDDPRSVEIPCARKPN
jgi:hypothetical protein